ncbi:hypothetical protein [Listeria aquatica]|nr:hypothetical protein [Listeria aquatica]
MGADIHLFVEKKNQDNEWKAVLYEDGSYDGLYDVRNYSVFAILADVRNGYGFAGGDIGDAFNPVSFPKGIPYNASEEFLKVRETWDIDGHSDSYLTLKELRDFNWDQKTMKRGFVDEEGYKEFLKTNEVNSWSTDVFGNVGKISNDDMELLVSGKLKLTPFKPYYTQVECEVTYTVEAAWFFGKSFTLFRRFR